MSTAPETLEGLEHTREHRAGEWGRRVFVTALTLFVGAGLLGLLGVRASTATVEAGGYEVEVEHASIARAGLDVPWRVKVTREGGFDKELELAVTGRYFDIFETQGFSPTPSKETRDGDIWYLTFDTPDTDTFVLSYDAYIQPSSQQGAAGSLSVVESGVLVVTVPFRTRLLP